MDLGNVSQPPQAPPPPAGAAATTGIHDKIARLEDQLQSAQNDAIRDRLLKLEIKDLVSSSVRAGTAADDALRAHKTQPPPTDDTAVGGMDLMSLAMMGNDPINSLEAPPPKEDDKSDEIDELTATTRVRVRQPRKRTRPKRTTTRINETVVDMDLLESDDELEPIGTGFFHSKGAPKEGAQPVDKAALDTELLKIKLDRTIQNNINDTADIFRTLLERDAIEFQNQPVATVNFRTTNNKNLSGNLAFLNTHGFLIEDQSKQKTSQNLNTWRANLAEKAKKFSVDSDSYDMSEIDAVLTMASGFDLTPQIKQKAQTILQRKLETPELYDIEMLSNAVSKKIQNKADSEIESKFLLCHLFTIMFLRHVVYHAFFQLVYNNPIVSNEDRKKLDDLIDVKMYALTKYMLNLRHAFDKGRDIPSAYAALFKYFILYHFRMLMEIDRLLKRTTTAGDKLNTKLGNVAQEPQKWWLDNHNINDCKKNDNKSTPFMMLFNNSMTGLKLECNKASTGSTGSFWTWFTSPQIDKQD